MRNVIIMGAGGLGTPIDLGRLVDLGHPVRRAFYELREVGVPSLSTVLAPHIEKWLGGSGGLR
jgi:hypothetical protein